MTQCDNSSKRPKLDILQNLKIWIEEKDGFVHPAVELQGRRLMVTESIPKETVIMKIPCLVNVQTIVENDPSWDNRIASIRNLKDQLENPIEDLAMALYLASQPTSIEPYLGSLPPDLHRLLPRHWKNTNELLEGSPLVDRINASRIAIESDWKRLSTIMWDDTSKAPSLELFNGMMAAVSSRAFHGVAGMSTLVPLLDLCNHHRGNVGPSKNLAYAFDDDVVTVSSTQDIDKDEELRITYGAQGNHQLLLNGGFCILGNFEPDGSSNDALEVSIHGHTVFLRAGPKSYSYSPFVKALELFMDDSGDNHADQVDALDPEVDDIDDFLNSCESDDNCEEGNCMACYQGHVMGDEDEMSDENTRAKLELEALIAFRQFLIDLKKKYTTHEHVIKARMCSVDDLAIYHTSVLVSSEWRTIYFYLAAINAVRVKLGSTESTPIDAMVYLVSTEDERRIEAQVGTLADVFMQIRHPDLLSE